MSRWRRAERWLGPRPGRVLDCGCGTGLLAKRLADSVEVIGVDHFLPVASRAARSAPQARFIVADTASLPFEEASFDAAACLDVLEHVSDPSAVVSELARVLRDGGQLVVSMPHRGAFAALDSMNLYQRLLPRANPPTDDPSWRANPHHAHVSASELADLLRPHFRIVRMRRTGTGVVEPLNLVFLLMSRAISPRLNWLHYRVLGQAYNALAALDDSIPMGRRGYNVTALARRDGRSTMSAPSAPTSP